jgi:hypothetical protein
MGMVGGVQRMEGQSHTYPNEMRRVMGEVANPWYNSCKARKARTHAAASRLFTTNGSSEESAQDSKGEEGEMVCVGKEEEEVEVEGGDGVGGCG